MPRPAPRGRPRVKNRGAQKVVVKCYPTVLDVKNCGTINAANELEEYRDGAHGRLTVNAPTQCEESSASRRIVPAVRPRTRSESRESGLLQRLGACNPTSSIASKGISNLSGKWVIRQTCLCHCTEVHVRHLLEPSLPAIPVLHILSNAVSLYQCMEMDRHLMPRTISVTRIRTSCADQPAVRAARRPTASPCLIRRAISCREGDCKFPQQKGEPACSEQTAATGDLVKIAASWLRGNTGLSDASC
jgi:hypothetical protein